MRKIDERVWQHLTAMRDDDDSFSNEFNLSWLIDQVGAEIAAHQISRVLWSIMWTFQDRGLLTDSWWQDFILTFRQVQDESEFDSE